MVDPSARTAAGLGRYSAVAAIALCLMAIAGLGIFALHRSSQSGAQRSRRVATRGRQAYIVALSRESALNSYLVSHDSSLLAADTPARGQLLSSVASLARLTSDNEAQLARARAIGTALAAWDSAFTDPLRRGEIISARRRDTARQLFLTLRERLDAFLSAEDVLYTQRANRDDVLNNIAVVGVLLPIGLMFVVFRALRRQMTTQGMTVGDQRQRLDEQAVELRHKIEALERVDAERARIAAFLDSALGSAPVGIAFFDTDLRFLRVNNMIASMRGPSADSVVGQLASDAIPVRWYRILEPLLRQALDSGKPVLDVRMPAGVPNSDGRIRDLIVSFYPVLSPSGETLGVGYICIDITDRAELEEQMRQAQKMEAIGRLAGGVAHDFNNLLTVIRSYCDLILLEVHHTSPHVDELREIRAAADRAAALARQLLAFSRKQVIVAQSVDVNELVHGLEAMLSRLFSEEVTYDLELDPAVGRVRADPGHLEQVLVNLAINAADAMPTGGRITIRTGNVALDVAYADHHEGVTPGEYVRIGVSDTGIGMDAATQTHIFEPFFTTKPPGKGTGLGLSTVYGIVRQLGGHIAVRSEPLRGTTFDIFLPRDRADAPAPPLTAPEAVPPRSAVSQATVLVVEDEPAVRLTIVRILERRGFRVLQAAHGGEAIRVASEQHDRIDLVISDLMMPEMSGREFVERFSATRPETRVLFMSGYTDDISMQQGMIDGSHDFIEKPFTVDQISRKIQSILARDGAFAIES